MSDAPDKAAPPMYFVGHLYSRADIYQILRIPNSKQQGDWLNGYHRHGSDYYIFCNIGVAGRTGDNYDNRWEGSRLIWFGKHRSNFEQDSIKNLISGHYRVLIFYRDNDRQKFTFAGLGNPKPHCSTRDPVRIDWEMKPLKEITP